MFLNEVSDMADRRGERIGWTGGWLGAFLWLAVLSVVFLFQGQWGRGCLGIILTGIAVAGILCLAPWRFPHMPYWKLMLPLYLIFLLSVAWAVWAYGGFASLELSPWNLLWLIPLLTPFGSMSRRTWDQSEVGNKNQPNKRSSIADS
jgi:phosphatidylserine synthase